jgi:hypothetical protein
VAATAFGGHAIEPGQARTSTTCPAIPDRSPAGPGSAPQAAAANTRKSDNDLTEKRLPRAPQRIRSA